MAGLVIKSHATIMGSQYYHRAKIYDHILVTDLDNFKVYNDVYGVKQGDVIILLVSRILTWSLRRYGSSSDFLGHLGFIIGRDRSGLQEEFPLVSVSLAQVDCQGQYSRAAIARRSAEMKKFAKKVQGNSYVRDRRGPLSPDGLMECGC